MPQKWNCKCGEQVPIHLSFCGHCGVKWTKVAQHAAKQAAGQAAKHAKSSNKPQEHGGGFSVPSVGLLLPIEGQQIQQSPHTQHAAQVKSLKTALHQKANRIGKIESRISKLEAALADAQQRWPIHVAQIQQQLQADHTKFVQFQQAAANELLELRKEWTHLSSLGTQLVTPPQSSGTMTQVQAAVEVLTAAGILPNSYAGVGHHVSPPDVQMEDDVQSSHDVQSFSLPNLSETVQQPSLPVLEGPQTVQTFPLMSLQQPVGGQFAFPDVKTHASVDFQRSVQEPSIPVTDPGPPPGNWAPVPAPSMNANGKEQPEEQFPNPIYKPPAVPQLHSVTPQVPVTKWIPQANVQPAAPEVAEAVHKAVIGLQEHHINQGCPGGPEMTEEYQQLIDAFTVQQNMCHAQLAQIQASAATISQKQVGQPKNASMAPFGAVPKPVPTQGIESVCSSPGPRVHGKAEEFSLSSVPSRFSKVPKALPGAVHEQPAANTEEIPSSEVSSPRSPTPVPTEIAESEWHGPPPEQELD